MHGLFRETRKEIARRKSENEINGANWMDLVLATLYESQSLCHSMLRPSLITAANEPCCGEAAFTVSRFGILNKPTYQCWNNGGIQDFIILNTHGNRWIFSRVVYNKFALSNEGGIASFFKMSIIPKSQSLKNTVALLPLSCWTLCALWWRRGTYWPCTERCTLC